MVNFGQKLETNKNPKWADKYVNYDGLKKLIKAVAKKMNAIRQASINLDTGADGALPQLGEETDEDDFYESSGEAAAQRAMNRANTVDETANLLGKGRRSTRRYGSGSTYELTSSSFEDNEVSGSAASVARKQAKTYEQAISVQILHHNPDEDFVKMAMREAAKVDAFYRSEMGELKGRVKRLQETVSLLKRSHLHIDPDVEEESQPLPKDVLTADSAKRAFRDVYRELKFLQNFTILNYTAFVKIFKKHDKATGLKTVKQMMRSINKYRDGFIESPELHELMSQVERIVARAYFSGNRTLARSELLLKHHTLNSWEMMHIGLRIGMVLILCCWVIWDVAVDTKSVFGDSSDKRVQHQMNDTLRVFRGFGFLVMWLWLWPVCLYIWTSARINYIYLFEFDPRRSLLWEEALSRATTVTIIFLSLMLAYVKITLGALGPGWLWLAKYFPVFLFVYMCSLMVFPLEQTSTVIDTMLKIMTAPMHEVTFFQSFAADVLTSMARPLVDIAFTFCFFFSGDWHRVFNLESKDPGGSPSTCEGQFNFSVVPVIISMPLMFRIFQNLRRYYDTGKRFPHLPNVFKYFLAQQLVLLGALHPTLEDWNQDGKRDARDAGARRVYQAIFLISLCGSTVFTFFWDVRMDWGIRTLRGPHLRGVAVPSTPHEPGVEPTPVPRKLLLHNLRVYYSCILADLFLRFTWCLTLIPNDVLNEYIDSSHLNFLLGTAELVRRTFWSVLRVEYEHAYNEHEYRRVEHVPVLFEQGDDNQRNQRTWSKTSVFAELGLFSAVVLFFFAFAFVNEEASGEEGG